MDIAKERYAQRTKEDDEQTEQILSRKLKPKGNKLL